MGIAGLALLSGCDKPTRPPTGPRNPPHRAGPYFDVRGLLDAQSAAAHRARRAGVEKHVSLRGSAPATTRVPQVKWAR
ncbi:MAG: hypothetical protein WKG07_45100 [Hymenobacter sp.]